MIPAIYIDADQIVANTLKAWWMVAYMSMFRWFDEMIIDIDAAQLLIFACGAALVSSKNLSSLVDY